MNSFATRFANADFIRTFFHTYRLFKADPRCSCRALFRAIELNENSGIYVKVIAP